jgi:hypothetical protein
MAEYAPDLPAANDPSFIMPGLGLVNTSVWRNAVVQLIISLFPHEFLPEILGYNLHYESIKLETLIAARELGELGINPYYFTLHISIDNADSGHTAMALNAVEEYLEIVLANQGIETQSRAWKRVRTGFALSEGLERGLDPLSIEHASIDEQHILSDPAWRFVEMILRKCHNSDRIHCGSGLRLKGRKLAEWLRPELLSSRIQQAEFVRCLGEDRYWIQKGDSVKSRLIRELSWGGRMFGAFTTSEVNVVKAWIESLNEKSQREANHTKVSTCPEPEPFETVFTEYASHVPCQPLRNLGLCPVDAHWIGPVMQSMNISRMPAINMSILLPIWFVHPCLLQGLVSIPFRSATNARCAILRFLRAQAGFGNESEGVAGMDEAKRTNVIGLIDIGLEMVEGAGCDIPCSPAEALKKWPCNFAVEMLRLSLHPEKNFLGLLGISWALVDLHDEIADRKCLKPETSLVLENIAGRERKALFECVESCELDESAKNDVSSACGWAREQLECCFAI